MKNIIKSKFINIKKLITDNDYLLALLVGLIVLLSGTFFGWYNNKVVPLNTDSYARYTLEAGNKLSYMSNWDGPNYIHIATHGYTSSSLTNFFPLYPLLVHGVNQIVSSPLYSALIVSWVAFLFAVFFFIKIIKLIFKDINYTEKIRALLLFIFFPTAVFFIATYTESLLAALALGAIYFTLKKRFYLASVLTIFSSATHLTGEFVVLLIMMMSWENRHSIKRFLSVGVVGSLGLLSYAIYLDEKFHKPLLFISSQEKHGWIHSSYLQLLNSIDLFNIIFIILLLLSAVYWWSRKRSFSVYSLLFLLIPILGREFGGFNRYILMAFPVQLMFYGYLKKRPALYPIVLALFVITWTYFLLQYAGGYVGG